MLLPIAFHYKLDTCSTLDLTWVSEMHSFIKYDALLRFVIGTSRPNQLREPGRFATSIMDYYLMYPINCQDKAVPGAKNSIVEGLESVLLQPKILKAHLKRADHILENL